MRETETPRLKLRRVTEGDTQAIYDGWATDPQVTKYLTWHPHRNIEDTRMVMDYWLVEYSKENCYRWGIELKETGTLIGMIDVVGYEGGIPLIGYCLARKHWGRGYMTEALKAIAEELFAEGFAEIKAEAVEENAASNRVIQKVGFEYVESRNVPLSLVKPEIVTVNSYRLRKP